MAENSSKEADPDKSFSVSSKAKQPSRGGTQISINIPSLKKSDLQKLKQPKIWSKKAVIALLLIAALISGYIGAWIQIKSNQGDITVASLGKQEKIVTNQSQLIDQIAKTVGPSVVSVNVSITSSSSNNSFGLFGFTQPDNMQAAGTGIIISSSGLIITNRHVVPAGTTNVSITLSDGTQLKDVSVIGRTNDNDSLDIAFLKINNASGHKLSPAVIGDSSTVQIGDSVVAIGNALGQFQNTVTSGIISGYGRSVQAGDSSGSNATENLDDLFQTDAAINEGNSGGPLVNLNGQVIGINTAIAGNAQNIGFSIPINDVRGLIEQVIKTGKFSRPYLGVRYIPLTADVANEFGLNVSNGAFIAPSSDPSNPSIVSGSPADQAGLKENDVIVSVNGTSIDQTHSLTSLLDQHQPGDTVHLTILRGNSNKDVNVMLGSMPSS